MVARLTTSRQQKIKPISTRLPAKYAPQYGGFCANGMSKRKLADIDPNQFFIYKGKLYVCTAAAESLKEFSAKPDVKIQAFVDKKLGSSISHRQIPDFAGIWEAESILPTLSLKCRRRPLAL